MNSSKIYFDNAATSLPSQSVILAMEEFRKKKFGNASSLHKLGVQASLTLEMERKKIASKLNTNPEQVIFTSGGTESNNWAIRGLLLGDPQKKHHIIVSKIEHSSVLETARWLETQGVEVSYAPVDEMGLIQLDVLDRMIKKETSLISVMHANNEVGVIQDLHIISSICRSKRIPLHVDACQSFCKIDLDLSETKIDLLSISAHKIHGPVGIGALFIREGIKLSPLLFGGGQERGLRPGTYNTEAIVGFGKAVEEINQTDIQLMKLNRDYLMKNLNDMHQLILNGPIGNKRLCNIVNISFKKASAKKILFSLNKKDIFVSTGAACSSGKKTPSHVLLAMGKSITEAMECIRISISKWTTKDEIDRFLVCLKDELSE